MRFNVLTQHPAWRNSLCTLLLQRRSCLHSHLWSPLQDRLASTNWLAAEAAPRLRLLETSSSQNPALPLPSRFKSRSADSFLMHTTITITIRNTILTIITCSTGSFSVVYQTHSWASGIFTIYHGRTDTYTSDCPYLSQFTSSSPFPPPLHLHPYLTLLLHIPYIYQSIIVEWSHLYLYLYSLCTHLKTQLTSNTISPSLLSTFRDLKGHFDGME